MSETPADGAGEAPILFRRGKKRKTYRQRAGDNDNDETAATTSASASTDQKLTAEDDGTAAAVAITATAAVAANTTASEPETQTAGGDDDDAEEKGLSVAEVLRLRNARRTKLRGAVLGRAGSTAWRWGPCRLDRQVRGAASGKRFSAQTGLVVELVNRHMDEYIESELARRQAAEDAAKEKAAGGGGGGGGLSLFSRSGHQARQQQQQQQQQQQSSLMSRWASPSGSVGLDDQAAPGVTALRGEGLQQPALRGKLQEVDLGQEMRSRNVALTQRATMKGGGDFEDDDNEDDDEDDNNKDGTGGEGSASKPAAKGRKRRASDDAIRDKMVEEFLRENKVDLYDMADQEERDGEMAHDDRVAEQFRREFFEAMSQRNRRRRPAVNHHKRPSTRKEEEILKGPKLGGSRNERAHMRDILLKQANEKREAAKRL
ncbi:hypothetical protein MAPG_06494 [Magnaporthiopsis poae ATCC 64411]|uniref:Uncharacterized protein n=1 Tax=Magnaporthiopsis poae (strain ATCC 64411 / 73-15) TaxID=644358 RepID=A0A0C4E265_MAGP6|nr:hypothetical protein MAPG_06494 [Magnaporthiopsis poae ATCC 64411]